MTDDTNIDAKNLFYCIIYVITVFLLIGFYYIFTGGEKAMIIIDFSAAFIFTVLFIVTTKYRCYKLSLSILSLFFNLVLFPLIVISAGDLYSYASLYMVVGIILTLYLLDPPELIIQLVIIVIWDLFVIRFTYIHPELMEPYRMENHGSLAIYFNFLAGAIIPMLIFAYQNLMYERVMKRIKESDEAIQKANISKAKFLANMTHEIKTPMNTIIGMNELILNRELPGDCIEEAENIRDASNQLLRIVNDTLIYSRLESDRWKLKFSAYSFYDMISEVIDNFSETAMDSNIDVYAFIDAGIPKLLYGDDISIKQIFEYILGNSLQQDIRQRVAIEILGERLSDPNKIRLECRVSESGKGLKKEEIESLLKAYKKYDSRQDSDLKGLGLEVSICEELLQLMGGQLKIESVEGVGISIKFSFENYILDDERMVEIDNSPVKHILIYLHTREDENIWKPLFENISVSPDYVMSPVSFKAALENRDYSYIFVRLKDHDGIKDIIAEKGMEDKTYVIIEHKRKNDSFGSLNIVPSPINSICISEIINGTYKEKEHRFTDVKKKIRFKDTKILVVEDSMINLKVLSGMLDSLNAEYDLVTNGEKCIDFIKTNVYDLILLDRRMPGMDGKKTLDIIRTLDGDKSSLPVICITSEIGRDVRKNIIDEGFDDYIMKPVKSRDLVSCLKDHLPDEKIVEENYYIPTAPKIKVKEPAVSKNDYDISADPGDFDVNRGIENIGGDREIYNEILLTYYHEGKEKIGGVKAMSAEEDLSLFTTTVHALKSSSASVGADGISTWFKQLEMAGKAGDREFIDENLDPVTLNFKDLLTVIKKYLDEYGLLEDENEVCDEAGDLNDDSASATEEVNIGALEMLYGYMDRFDLKNAEIILNDISGHRYEKETGHRIKDIKSDFDTFEYFKAKDKTKELIDIIKSK